MPECEIRTERSFCRVCTAQCGILVDMEGDRVVKVRGDRDHPVSRGYTCPKGRALPEMHHHPRRIERPQMKTATGSFEAVSWEHCLDDMGAKLCRIVDAHGPSAIGIFFGSGLGMDPAGYRMAEALHAAIGTPAKFSPLTIDGTAKSLVASLVGGFPGLQPRPDYERVNLVIYIGVNPMISHGHTIAMPNPAPTIKAVRDRGEVWVIDPRENETAAFATRHMAPRPGTDYAVMAYLVRELLRDGADRDVLAHKTMGGDALRAAVAPFDLEHAAEISGVDIADIKALLASVRKAGHLAIDLGTGVTMSQGANLTVWLAWVVMILTGSMNRRGGVWFHPGFVNQLDGGALPMFDMPFGPGPPSRPELNGILGDWPCAALPDEINAGNIRGFLNLGGSLIRSFPDANALAPALQKLEVFATIEIVENETTALSTHVLPTKDQLERADVALWDFLSSRVNVQYTPAALRKPVGDRRAGWWVLSELMKRLGKEPPGPLPDTRDDAADRIMLARTVSRARCSFDEMVDKRYVETAFETPAAWVDEHIARLGGWRLAPAALVDQLAAVGATHLVAARTEPVSLSLIPRRQRRHLNAQYLFLEDGAEVLLHPDDAVSAGVEDGRPVVVRSVRGEVVAIARVDRRIRRGAVSFPHGYEDANVNVLTDTKAVDPLTGMARYSGFDVSIHPVAARSPA